MQLCKLMGAPLPLFSELGSYGVRGLIGKQMDPQVSERTTLISAQQKFPDKRFLTKGVCFTWFYF